jgi:hypothetical protein
MSFRTFFQPLASPRPARRFPDHVIASINDDAAPPLRC